MLLKEIIRNYDFGHDIMTPLYLGSDVSPFFLIIRHESREVKFWFLFPDNDNAAQGPLIEYTDFREALEDYIRICLN